MKQVNLKRLLIDNFKCFPHLEVDFNSDLTSVSGPNGSGKTSLYDAYLWVTTGADSAGVSEFKVQPLDGKGSAIEKLVTKVKAEFELLDDGNVVDDFTIERTYSQVWSVPRGKSVEEFRGNTSVYIVNGVPVAMKEYYAAISENICPISDLRMLSSVYTFFALGVNDRRKKLMEMAGDIEDILTPARFPSLYDAMTTAKSIEGVKKQATYALKELKESQDAIPSKKTENERDLPSGIDFDALRSRKVVVEKEIMSIDSLLQASADAANAIYDKINETTKKVSDVNTKLVALDYEFSKKISEAIIENGRVTSDIDAEISVLQRQRNMSMASVREMKVNIDKYEAKIKELGEKWYKVRDSKLEKTLDSACPTCGRPFSQEELEATWNAMLASFNSGKAAEMKTIANEGASYKELLNQVRMDYNSVLSSIDKLDAKIEQKTRKRSECASSEKPVPSIDNLRQSSEEYQRLLSEKDSLQESLKSIIRPDTSESSALKSRKRELQYELESLIRDISKEDIISRVEERRKELDRESERIAIDIASKERVLQEIRDYTKAHINVVEEKIASMFALVKFQMYERNISNDGEKEMCECLVDGVPYSTNVNTASRINAGIDVVNALSRSMGLSVPMWIDNKESVTDLIYTKSQIITLSVSGERGSLTII